MTMSLEERFWPKVDKDGPTMSHMDSNCWVWTAAKTKLGYGQFRVGSSMQYAHRVSLSFGLGRMPQPQALHACDNPSCVRPSHLSEGTRERNMKEAYDRGRRQVAKCQGEQHGNAKLNESDVREIRKCCSEGETQAALSRRYGISGNCVSRIVRRKAWAHV